MAENSKKRTNSFRKLFKTSFFSSHKSKDKNKSEGLKNGTGTSSKSNHYQSPRPVVGTEKYNQGNTDCDERIYENLTVSRHAQNVIDTASNDVSSHHSSSSTLVSVAARTPLQARLSRGYPEYAARPQVPPRPQNEPHPQQPQSPHECNNSQYPDVYYHSLEGITDQISPLDEIEIYKATHHTQVHPASVGAEIKRVSTKFLISPKKEAEVRTIQPTRARSLSFENKELSQQKESPNRSKGKKTQSVTKPYNYSAPTSPIPLNHKIPNMPKTVSPYEHVRKTMIEAEEKRNTLNRPAGAGTKSTPSPRLENYNESGRTSTPILEGANEHAKLTENTDKEKTRQKVEAFYWQKLKELKKQEDEYLLRQSMDSSMKNVSRRDASYSISNCSSPNSFSVEKKSYSLPRGRNLQGYCSINQPIYSKPPFSRGAPERRTDTFISNRNNFCDSDVVYRHPEKLSQRSTLPVDTTNDSKQMPIFQRGSLTREVRNINPQPKRVSFEEHYEVKSPINVADSGSAGNQFKVSNQNPALNSNKKTSDEIKGSTKVPPRPPIRTTSVSVGKEGEFNRKHYLASGNYSIYSESESGSEAGEIQRILQNHAKARQEEDWHGDGSRIDGGLSDGEASRGPTRGRTSRRDDPRRHTLAGNHLYVHPHHQTQLNSIEMEPPLPRSYPPPTNALLFDDDPGIMSEVETSSTGFRRGGKQRSSLPVVRTPSKTLERPLGLVFLQYRNETKRALLPNEITSIDTVKALFVRSFPKQLTMQYMDSPLVKIYIHDSSKDMFYELEDVRAHLRDIRDRSVLRLFEATDMGGGVFPGAVGVGSLTMPPGAATCSGPSSWDQDQNYFSEPEIDSEYHHHVHKSSKVKAPAYYIGTGPAPSTLPRGGSMLRAFSPAAPPVPADRGKTLPGTGHSGDGYMSSPERGSARPYEDPYYTQFLGPAAGRATITPIIDEESSDGVIIDESYQMYGVNPAAPRPMPRPPYDSRLNPQVDDIQRLRVEKMERQLANLTGLVQKALQVPGQPSGPPPAPRQEFQAYVTAARPPNADAARFGSNERPPKLGRDKFQKSVSFEKSVSFSDDPPDMNSPKQHSPQHSERDRLKPAPPPKPAGLAGQQLALVQQRTYTINVTPDFFSQLRVLQKQSRDLRIETRNLRRSTLSHAIQMRQLMADTIVKIGALAASLCEDDPESQLTREEEIYRQDMLLLENDLYELEATVERLRGQAANRETRVNMADIERIAMVLSKSSKTVADWKLKFPILQDTMKIKLSSEMEKVVRKEKMLEDEPERLELALRRCKKLTGTLVTLKRLACVQEQRLPIADGRLSPGSSQGSSFTAGPSSEEFTSEGTCHVPQTHNKGTGGACAGRGAAGRGAADVRPENALDALLDELQTFAKPCERGAVSSAGVGVVANGGAGEGSLRRLHSYPSGSDTDASPPVRARGQHPPKPPVPERHPELLALAARRAPPPPPPRTTSRSPLASPTSPASPPRAQPAPPPHAPAPAPDTDTDTADDKPGSRQAVLELRHQELLKKQKALQEQYARLQMIQRSGPTLPPQPDLKKTGSESNLLAKMNLNLSPAAVSGSMTHLATNGTDAASPAAAPAPDAADLHSADTVATTNKVYETDIL